MSKFIDWFTTKLKCSGFPTEEGIDNNIINQVDIVINVSDENINIRTYKKYAMYGIQYYWFPMNEISKTSNIGINSVFGALNILFEAEKDGKIALVHCHAGVNRSRTIIDAYYYMRTNKHLNDTIPEIDESFWEMFNIENSEDSILTGYSNNRLVENCNSGNLPVLRKFEKFLHLLNLQLIAGEEVSIDNLLLKSQII